MTNEQIKQWLECCTSHNAVYAGANCIACPYKEKVACKGKLRKDLLNCLNAETQLKELLSALYKLTDNVWQAYELCRDDVLKLAKDYGIKEEELKK